MEHFEEILDKIKSAVWGIPLIVLILATGIILTLRTHGIQFKKLMRALKSIMQKPSGKDGEVSSFGALCTALSATIGTGNIVGVASAIAVGGPGALFWMWIAALLGMSTKYAECMLAVKYRQTMSDGHILGGPFYTIEKGMGEKWRWLAVLFAIFGAMAGLLGIGTMTQVNGIASAAKSFFDPDSVHIITLFGKEYSLAIVLTGLVVTVCSALVIIGGIRRISKVAQVIVPFMAILYFVIGVFVILFNFSHVSEAFELIFQSAFAAKAFNGGLTGTSLILALRQGVARGIFSNEAGLGSAPIAASAAKVEEPVAQGLVSMTGTFIDTIIICTITGLAIIISGEEIFAGGLMGVDLSTAAFQSLFMKVFGEKEIIKYIVKGIMMVCLAFFAFTTILGWDYYSERCLEYLFKGNMGAVKIYRWLYILAVFAGPYLTLNAVWTIADITNALMAIPNIISLLALSGVVAQMTDEYFKKFPQLDAIEPVSEMTEPFTQNK